MIKDSKKENREFKKTKQNCNHCEVIPWIVQRAYGEGEKEHTQCELAALEIFLEKN